MLLSRKLKALIGWNGPFRSEMWRSKHSPSALSYACILQSRRALWGWFGLNPQAVCFFPARVRGSPEKKVRKLPIAFSVHRCPPLQYFPYTRESLQAPLWTLRCPRGIKPHLHLGVNYFNPSSFALVDWHWVFQKWMISVWIKQMGRIFGSIWMKSVSLTQARQAGDHRLLGGRDTRVRGGLRGTRRTAGQEQLPWNLSWRLWK